MKRFWESSVVIVRIIGPYSNDYSRPMLTTSSGLIDRVRVAPQTSQFLELPLPRSLFQQGTYSVEAVVVREDSVLARSNTIVVDAR